MRPRFSMPRLQDLLFILLALVIAAMLAFRLGVALIALIGAFACGALYLLAGMVPDRRESLGRRLFTTAFLSLVASSLVLILPGTVGVERPGLRTAVIALAGLIPLLAIGFELLRTPRLIDALRRRLRLR